VPTPVPYVLSHKGRELATGFTLIELLVVIAILAILAALGFQGLQSMQMGGKQAATTATLRGMGNALNLYAADNNGRLPGPSTVAIYGWARNPPRSSDQSHLGIYLAPYLGLPADGQKSICEGLMNPALSAEARNTTLQSPPLAQFVKVNASTNELPDSPLWGTLNNPSTIAAANAATNRPKSTLALSDKARRAAVITTADRQSWGSVQANVNLLPATGSFRGKRLWLFLDGSVSGPVTNATIWFR
jgi:prepilin-type N-terminal cleavage/methylation domain-containing protein